MDIGRRAYDAECRFWKNSPDTATIRWYEASNHAETLGQDTAIGMGDRESPNYVDYPVGEVAIQDRTFGNLCQEKGPGTLPVSDPDSLREGGVLDRSRTPQQYQPNGIACSCLPLEARPWRNGTAGYGPAFAYNFQDGVPGISVQVPCVKGWTLTNLQMFIGPVFPWILGNPFTLTLWFGSAPGLNDIGIRVVTATPTHVINPYEPLGLPFWNGFFADLLIPEDVDCFLTPFASDPSHSFCAVAWSDGEAALFLPPYDPPEPLPSFFFKISGNPP